MSTLRNESFTPLNLPLGDHPVLRGAAKKTPNYPQGEVGQHAGLGDVSNDHIPQVSNEAHGGAGFLFRRCFRWHPLLHLRFNPILPERLKKHCMNTRILILVFDLIAAKLDAGGGGDGF